MKVEKNYYKNLKHYQERELIKMKFVIDKNSGYQTIYKYNFSNLTDLYTYLKSNPRVNTSIFRNQASLDNESSFGGEPLEYAIEYLKGGYNINFDKFDIATRTIRKSGYEDVDSRKLTLSQHGGVYLSPLVAAGVPTCMIKYDRDTTPKHITIYFQLGYPWMTTADQVFNRGIATINLIQSLEEKGYIVDLKVFELSECDDEILDITVDVKKTDELLNITKCYYPFVSKEFLRRLLFRVLESAPVKSYWSSGYGQTCDAEEIKRIYKLREKDIVIPAPTNIGIQGNDIYEDTVSLFENLNLDKEFDLSRLKQKIR